MFFTVKNYARRKAKTDVRYGGEIDPDEIFLDSSNLPKFDRYQLEGRIERPISRRVIFSVGAVFFLFIAIFLARSFMLQISRGEEYLRRSEQNSLRHTIIFGERGSFYDRLGEPLAWNTPSEDGAPFSVRRYAGRRGVSHLLGYLRYPSRDSAGFYYQVDFEGMDGVEKYLEASVAPEHGLKIVETDVLGTIQSESILKRPAPGAPVTLSVDARLSEKLFDLMADLVAERGFEGGAAVILDVENGEMLSLVSFPEYLSQTLTDGKDAPAISRFISDRRKPFLNRATDGLYAPGSIIKPFIAVAALEEGVITPEQKITSTGSISVPNPYDPARPSVFKDWKEHGAVDMRKALAVSSDVYFYEIGGGFKEQRGIGIEKIEKYLKMFGFGEEPAGALPGAAGVIPNPAWKAAQFNGEPWRLGDTYHTAIGQYGMQVTPLQAAIATAVIANGGRRLEPRLVLNGGEAAAPRAVSAKPESFAAVRDGMRQAVVEGTASALNIPEVHVAAKTGTAELGVSKRMVNSWIIGFFPYERPRYAFAVVLERGPYENTVGALFVMRRLFEWMSVYEPEYLRTDAATSRQYQPRA